MKQSQKSSKKQLLSGFQKGNFVRKYFALVLVYYIYVYIYIYIYEECQLEELAQSHTSSQARVGCHASVPPWHIRKVSLFFFEQKVAPFFFSFFKLTFDLLVKYEIFKLKLFNYNFLLIKKYSLIKLRPKCETKLQFQGFNVYLSRVWGLSNNYIPQQPSIC